MAKPTEPCLSEEQVLSSNIIFTIYVLQTGIQRTLCFANGNSETQKSETNEKTGTIWGKLPSG